MATFYVDNTLHSAAGAVGTATGGGSGYILLEDVGLLADDTFVDYGIRITAGTGVGQQRRITLYDHTGHASGERYAAVDSNWTTVPDNTSAYEITVGCDGNSGAGMSPGAAGPFRTIDRAMDSVAAAGTSSSHQVYIKGGRVYAETATIDAVASTSAPVILEGYAATPGDEGVATIDGENSRSSGIASGVSGSICYVLRNLRVVNCTSHGFNFTNGQLLRLISCMAESNGGTGFLLGTDSILVDCHASSNGSYGFLCGSSVTGSLGTLFHACTASGNANHQFKGGGMILLFCRIRDIPAGKAGVYGTSSADCAIVVGCTIDGRGAANTSGVGVFFGSRYFVVNNIIRDVNVGLSGQSSEELRFSRNNLFFNCLGGACTNFPTGGGDVTADPQHVDAAGGDYRLKMTSPALRAGVPAYLDLGAMQHAMFPPVGGPIHRGVQS